jgi:hypothetical protein
MPAPGYIPPEFPAYLVQVMGSPAPGFPGFNIQVVVVNAETSAVGSSFSGPGTVLGTTCGVAP